MTGGWWNIRCKAGRRCPGFKDRVSREPMPKGLQSPAKGGRRMLPRKAPRTRTIVDRTVIRHRWARRAASGARVIYGEGTRQNDPVTSGEGVPAVREAVQAKRNPVAENRVKRLFSKNTGACQSVFQADV